MPPYGGSQWAEAPPRMVSMAGRKTTVMIVATVAVAAVALGALASLMLLGDNDSSGQWSVEPNRHAAYNGMPQELVIQPEVLEDVTVLYEHEGIGFTEDIPTGVDAGTYTVVYRVVSTTTGEIKTEDSVKATIMHRVATVIADDSGKVYGDRDPEFTATVTGLLGDDTVQYVLNRDQGEDFGAYSIYPTGEQIQGNYSVQYASGSFFIYSKVITVTADDASKAYGTADPSFTATKSEDVLVDYTVSREAGESIGNYKIHVTGQRIQGNYLVVFESGFFTIKETAASWSSYPSALSYTFDGYEHPLLSAGSAAGGTVSYRLSTGNYSTSIPTATEPGAYTIYCKVSGDGNHADSTEYIITSTIGEYVWNGVEVKEPRLIDGVYRIHIASELAWVSAQNYAQKGFLNKTISIEHDISLNNKEWTPIGSAQSSTASPFKGNVEGNGHTISQILVSGTSSYVGLFGYTNGGHISNLCLDKVEVSGSEYCAGLSGYLNATASNIFVTHTNVTGNRYVGSIAGYQTDTISDCSADYISITCERIDLSTPYSIEYLGNDAGSIVGMSNADIIGCRVSHSTVNAYRDVGGIVGNIQENVIALTVRDCSISYATIIVNIDGGNAGKIVGRATDNTVQYNNTSENTTILYIASQSDPTVSPNVLTGTYDYVVLKADGTMVVSKDSVVTSTDNIHQVTMDNVTIHAADGVPAITIESGAGPTIVIKNSVTLTGGQDADAIRVCEGASLVITGTGTLTATGNNGLEYLNAKYPGNITDDSLKSQYVGMGGSGIGNSHGNTGSITISDLPGLYVYGYGHHAYGIGGIGSTVIISKSTVYFARGGFDEPDFLISDYGNEEAEGGPGIGGEYVTISGSTVKEVYGGSKSAGIGAMFWQNTYVTIVNSIIQNVQGGNGSAGIGGSHPMRSTEVATIVKIVIENSKVNATGGHYAAGIGSGYDRKCGTQGWTDLTISITSYSEITAAGGKYGAAIGTGFHSGVLHGSIDGTVTCNVSEGTDTKTSSGYSYVAQAIGYGVVDSTREAKSLLDAEGNPAEIPFTVGGVSITNPFDPDRLADVKSKYRTLFPGPCGPG